MNILDENILEEQRALLQRWHVSCRQVGLEVSRKGTKDAEIIPLLLDLLHPTFFTHDMDFCRRGLCHPHYSLVILDVSKRHAAYFIRRLLRHPHFDTQAKRMGTVIRVSATGLSVFHLHAITEVHYPWHDTAGRTPGPALREEAASYATEPSANDKAEGHQPGEVSDPPSDPVL